MSGYLGDGEGLWLEVDLNGDPNEIMALNEVNQDQRIRFTCFHC